METKPSLTMLNALVKALNNEVDAITSHMSEEDQVIAWSKVQGLMLTVSSEAMALVADTAKIIGTTTNATSATDNLIQGILGTIDDKSKDKN